MNKQLFALLMIACLMLVSFSLADSIDVSTPYTDDNYSVIIEDNADLLTDLQEEKLTEFMRILSKRGNMVFITSNDAFSGSVEEYADNLYYDRFGAQNGSILYISMYSREICLHSEGGISKIIPNSKATSIVDNVFRYASNGDFYTTASKVFEQIDLLLNGKKIDETMKYTSNALISVVFSSVLVFGYISMNSKNSQPSKDQIIKNCKIKFSTSNTRAERVGQSKRYSPQSSSSSGGYSGGSRGGGGHSSHGSHHSGSGGSHRF